jgi:hypothetical protein
VIHPIQLLLSATVFAIAFYVYRRFRTSILDVIVFFTFLAAGLVFIAVPGLTTKLARLLGVGRGADLIFYLSILFFGFVCLKLYERIKKLERLLHQVVRDKAIKDAVNVMPGESKSGL